MIKYYFKIKDMQNNNINSDDFKFPSSTLPIEKLKDFLAIIKQDIKYFYIPFNFYHSIRVKKYMKKKNHRYFLTMLKKTLVLRVRVKCTNFII